MKPAGRARPPGSALIQLVERIVPRSQRDEWRAEWIAELAHSELPAWRLRVRALGALPDGFWFARHHATHAPWSATMLAHDVRYAARTLLRRPTFATIVVVTLALCIGASSAVFSIVEAVLLRGLAYRDLGALVAVWSDNPKERTDRYPVSVGDYFDWRQRSHSFEQLAGFFPIWTATYTAPSTAERLHVGAVSANFLRTLGVTPRVGRDFVQGEDRPGAAPVAILSYGFWTRVFQQDTAALGKVIVLDDHPYVVAGVMGADFTFPQNRVDVIVPLPILGGYLQRRGVHMLSVIGRLRPGMSIESARREMAGIGAQLRAEHPKEDAGLGISVHPLAGDLLGDVQRPILVLFAAVCAVLLVGCANVANLMLARAASRRRELAVRVAMGAPPGAIARQLLTESALLALAAGAFGVLLAFGATRALSSMLPAAIARVGHVRVDGRVLGFTLGASVLVALLCGIAPALRGAREATYDALPEAARGGTHGRRARRFQASLVVGELALAMVLTVSAGLLVNSFARLTAIDPGFRTDHRVRMKIDPPDARYRRGPATDRFFETVLRQTRALPGVRSAALVSRFPLHDGPLTSDALVEGAPYTVGDQPPAVQYRMASAGYFATMGIPVLAGREFLPSDNADSSSRLVAVVNRTAAIRLFATQNPLGKRLRLGSADSPLFTVVGVVGDIHELSLREAAEPEVYVSSRQGLATAGSIVVDYDGAPASLVAGVRRIVSSLDKTLPVFDVQSLEAVVAAARTGDRFTTALLSSFAALALVLAALGTYGVIAYGVAERTREFGVRMALGAQSREVASMVLREGLALFSIALPIAFAGMAWSNRALARLLFGVVPSDPSTIAAAVGALAGATAIACTVPALRASRVDPTIAIKG